MTGPRINPNEHGVSGTFGALERQPAPATDLVRMTDDGTPVTNSLVVATDTGNDHASVIRLIRDNLADFNEVGRVRFEIRPFETAGGTQRREIAIIDELAAMLLMTYLRNTPKVKDFKKRLVLDERTDQFVSIPIRSVHTAGAGMSVELGPYSLMSSDVVALFNALAQHINDTPGEFRMRSA